MSPPLRRRRREFRFQCSSASRKFLNREFRGRVHLERRVSVLFSEPKIPQSKSVPEHQKALGRFSALQRAENSSIFPTFCVSPSTFSFSALQRAENSSMRARSVVPTLGTTFQCSSASRKFLNVKTRPRWACAIRVSVLFSEPKIPQSWLLASTMMFVSGFSALQRAENSSIR